MNSDTKSRLLETAAVLFAENGYRGASVRHICDLARANPGAVSYHFGGKKQLYRTVLRRAATSLAEISVTETETVDDATPVNIVDAIRRILGQINARPHEMQLLLRDLADGGQVAVEALEPSLRAAFENLRLTIGEDSAPRGSAMGQELFLDLAAPLFLLTAAWPVLQRALDLDPDQRRNLLTTACRRTLEAHGFGNLT
ncbi:MAG: TetR family transcriptional regulator [Candidatus Sulfomarinibacteraceae bacterium]